MTAIRTQVLLALAFVLGACTSSQTMPPAPTLSTAELLSGEVWNAEPVAESAADMLLPTSQMHAFVDQHVNPKLGPLGRSRALAAAVASPQYLNLAYSSRTRTAADAFSDRSGNCLSFSAMFVALAREAGLDAWFHEVEMPPDWTNDSGVLIRWQHINVVVDMGAYGQRVFDFDPTADGVGYPGELVSDSRAAAHFFNNIGVEQMQAGDAGRAFAYFRRAIEEDGDFTPAWNNLGALYSRQGMIEHAEASYLRSLQIDADEFTAMNNLVRLYELAGNVEAAANYRARVMRYRDANPYYHFGLAQRALADDQLDAASRHLRNALRRKSDDHRFHLLRAEIMHAQGETARAESARRKAESLIADVRG